jgi:enoyl-CoA hydratase
MQDYTFLKLDVDEGIALVTINRPEALNALSRELLNELFSMFIQLRDDEATKVIIVTGTGKAFIAGADIAYMKDQDATGGERFAELGLAVLDLIESMAKPVIAAVNGFALGGGTEFALACDLVYASEKAKFGQPEVKLGIIPGFGGTQRLPRLIGRNAAKEWIFTGDIYPASKAAELGLVQAVFAPEALLDGARAVAKKMAAAGPIAVARAKTAINEGQDLSLKSGLAIEKMSFAGLFNTEDRLEGMTAFVEKRLAVFKNK